MDCKSSTRPSFYLLLVLCVVSFRWRQVVAGQLLATVGIALIGIGKALGISEGLVAGAILSGAYFGDKMSPLSDTTNLAPAMAGTDLFTHIRYMAITTVPSISIALIIFLIIGFSGGADGLVTDTSTILTAISDKFYISGWLFIVPVVVVLMIVRKVPAIPALLVGTLLGALFALIFQADLVAGIGGSMTASGLFIGIMKSLYGSISITTDNAMVTDLLSSGGMAGMLGTIWLIISAMIFGGVMESSGMLKRIAKSIISLVNSYRSIDCLHCRHLLIFQCDCLRSVPGHCCPRQDVCGYLQAQRAGTRKP